MLNPINSSYHQIWVNTMCFLLFPISYTQSSNWTSNLARPAGRSRGHPPGGPPVGGRGATLGSGVGGPQAPQAVQRPPPPATRGGSARGRGTPLRGAASTGSLPGARPISFPSDRQKIGAPPPVPSRDEVKTQPTYPPPSPPNPNSLLLYLPHPYKSVRSKWFLRLSYSHHNCCLESNHPSVGGKR